MIIRKAKTDDIGKITEIFNEARGTIKALGIDQWQDGYPTAEIVENDISFGRAYVVETDDGICATYVLQTGGDRTYDEIRGGKWLSGESKADYLAVHRVAIVVACRGRGIAEKMFLYAADYARERGLTSLRIDTHEGNAVMRRMLEKNRFVHCGVIYLESGEARVAYELLL